MPRAKVEDKLQAFRFRVSVIPVGGQTALDGAGFASCTMPSMTIETEPIKAGNWEFPRKVPISASVDTVTLTRGMVRNGSDMWNWITATLRGQAGRQTVLIELLNRFPRDPITLRAWHLYECIPISYKPGSDFDANTADISIAELGLDYNYFDEKEGGVFALEEEQHNAASGTGFGGTRMIAR